MPIHSTSSQSNIDLFAAVRQANVHGDAKVISFQDVLASVANRPDVLPNAEETRQAAAMASQNHIAIASQDHVATASKEHIAMASQEHIATSAKDYFTMASKDHLDIASKDQTLMAATDQVGAVDGGRQPLPNDALQNAFHDFVGQTFFGQMIASMRSTEQPSPYFHGGRAEEVFRGQLDQTLGESMSRSSAKEIAEPMFQLFQAQRG